ncbi:hypothetical protein ACFX14_031917 [Malus domestica]
MAMRPYQVPPQNLNSKKQLGNENLVKDLRNGGPVTRNEKKEEYVLLLIAHMKQRLFSSEEENVHSDDEDYDLRDKRVGKRKHVENENVEVNKGESFNCNEVNKGSRKGDKGKCVDDDNIKVKGGGTFNDSEVRKGSGKVDVGIMRKRRGKNVFDEHDDIHKKKTGSIDGRNDEEDETYGGRWNDVQRVLVDSIYENREVLRDGSDSFRDE